MPQADKLSEGAVKLLQEKQLAHFVTIMSGGGPQVTPVWIDVALDGSHVIVNTAEGRVKTNNIDDNPEVAVSVVDRANDFRYVLVRGTVVEQRSEGAAEHIDKMAKKYFGVDRYPNHDPNEPRVMVFIKPHHVVESGV